jgi:hypothetical protein
MNPAKLAFLINDTIEGIGRSNLRSIYVLDELGDIKKDCNGFPFYNMVSVQLMNGIIQSEIIKEALK